MREHPSHHEAVEEFDPRASVLLHVLAHGKDADHRHRHHDEWIHLRIFEGQKEVDMKTARIGQRDADWPHWYAEYIVREQAGEPLP